MADKCPLPCHTVLSAASGLNFESMNQDLDLIEVHLIGMASVIFVINITTIYTINYTQTSNLHVHIPLQYNKRAQEVSKSLQLSVLLTWQNLPPLLKK